MTDNWQKVNGRWYVRDQSLTLLGWFFVTAYVISSFAYCFQAIRESRRMLGVWASLQLYPIIFHSIAIRSADYSILRNQTFPFALLTLLLAILDGCAVRMLLSPLDYFTVFHGTSMAVRIVDLVLFLATDALHPWHLDPTGVYDTLPL